VVVSPLSKYYAFLLCYLGGAIAIFTVVVLGFGVQPEMAIVVMAVCTIAFGAFINSKRGVRRPNCGLALGFTRVAPNLAGLPGRRCTRCHTDLTVPTSP